MKKEQEQTYADFRHEYLWGTAVRNLKNADHASADAGFYSLGAMLMAYFAFEGHLNWLIKRLAPEVWEEEKRFFVTGPYQGTLGKYRFLCRLLHLPEPDASGGPFQTAKALQRLRDDAVHPKSEEGTTIVMVAENCYPPPYRGVFETEVSVDKAKRVLSDIKSLSNLVRAASAAQFPDLVDGDDAFTGKINCTITEASMTNAKPSPSACPGRRDDAHSGPVSREY